ncbi:MAG: hypothetical protein HYX51_04250 [Chloroflexi bacterium]|nr:hypothetical protein [Chloroflexota bacterium]
MIALLLIAVLATDVAVAVLFVSLRRGAAVQTDVSSLDLALTSEMEAVVMELRAQAEQAANDLANQKAQLRRMLAEIEARQAQQAAAPSSAIPAPAIARKDILRMAAEGQSFRAIAGRTGLSTEEVRLMLALAEDIAA